MWDVIVFAGKLSVLILPFALIWVFGLPFYLNPVRNNKELQAILLLFNLPVAFINFYLPGIFIRWMGGPELVQILIAVVLGIVALLIQGTLIGVSLEEKNTPAVLDEDDTSSERSLV